MTTITSLKQNEYQASGRNNAQQEAVACVKSALDDKKAQDINCIDLTGRNCFADHMVIATGTSETHLNTLANEVAQRLAGANHEILSVEGMPHNNWVIVDGGDIVVHLFLPSTRELYRLDKLWMADFDEDDDNKDQEKTA